MDDLNLGIEEIEFCENNDIDCWQIFDADSLKRSEWSEVIKSDRDYRLVCNTTPCKEYGHTLRTRSGHCVICNLISWRKQEDYHKSGAIYIAYSDELGLIKIGCTKSPNAHRRIESLNSTGYAGVDDWVLEKSYSVDDVGVAETELHNNLKFCQEFITYTREDNYDVETAKEIFDIEVEDAIKIAEELL